MSQDFDINVWLECFKTKLISQFDKRLRFFGLQGSYGRGEQTAGSDIDVVVVIDGMSRCDMFAYRNMIDTMDCSNMICGFVAGSDDLRGWEKSDLLQLFLDTKPIIGSLDSFGIFFTNEDIRRAVKTGACNIYHACLHNFLHAKNMEVLVELFKSARFTVRMKYYCDTGNYVASFCRLKDVVPDDDRQILLCAASVADECNSDGFDGYSLMLVGWAGNIIRAMR